MVEIIEKMPDAFDPERGEPIPQQLIGATILRIGTLPATEKIEGGGLAIEYRRPRGTEHRIVFEFTELGMHVRSDVELTSSAPASASPDAG